MDPQQPNPVLPYATPHADLGRRAWIVLRTYGNSWEANLAAGKLRAQGIPCTLADENIVSTGGVFYTGAAGGIKLMVMPEDAQNAQAFFPQGPKPALVKCPRCASAATCQEHAPLVLRLMGYALMGLPWLLFGCVWRCECGHRWRRSLYAEPDDDDQDPDDPQDD